MVLKWFTLPCQSGALQLLGTLNGGQSFRWKILDPGAQKQWMGVFASRVWLLEQQSECIRYQVYDERQPKSEQFYNQILSHYLHLDVDLEEHYAQWGALDPHFQEAAKQFYGIRILRQDITENLFSFICSQNNHISRITSLVEKLAQFYGEKICERDGTTYYSFPEVEKLAEDGVEQKLRESGFGYRAKYISQSAKVIAQAGGKKWLRELQELNYADAKKRLMSLMGIGAKVLKVADCICLMSLGHLQAIPVDTHIYQIAARFYMPTLAKQKTVTEKVYNEIGDHFRELYGPLAGWAHTVLFCADLKLFQEDTKERKAKKRKAT